MAVARRLPGRTRVQHRGGPDLRSAAGCPVTQLPRGGAGGGCVRCHLPDRLGTGPVGRVRIHRPRGHRQVRVPFVDVRDRVEPGRHGRRRTGDLGRAAAVGADRGAVDGAVHDGCLRPDLRHPHGRCHDGAEGGGRGCRPAQRGPLPVTDPELLGRDHDHRRRGLLPLPVPRRRTAARLPTACPGRPQGDRLRPPGRPGLPATATR